MLVLASCVIHYRYHHKNVMYIIYCHPLADKLHHNPAAKSGVTFTRHKPHKKLPETTKSLFLWLICTSFTGEPTLLPDSGVNWSKFASEISSRVISPESDLSLPPLKSDE